MTCSARVPVRGRTPATGTAGTRRARGESDNLTGLGRATARRWGRPFVLSRVSYSFKTWRKFCSSVRCAGPPPCAGGSGHAGLRRRQRHGAAAAGSVGGPRGRRRPPGPGRRGLAARLARRGDSRVSLSSLARRFLVLHVTYVAPEVRLYGRTQRMSPDVDLVRISEYRASLIDSSTLHSPVLLLVVLAVLCEALAQLRHAESRHEAPTCAPS